MDIYDRCLGCDGKSDDFRITENHIHYWRNRSGRVVVSWFIEGICYNDIDDAVDFVKGWKNLGTNDALNLIGNFPKHQD